MRRGRKWNGKRRDGNGRAQTIVSVKKINWNGVERNRGEDRSRRELQIGRICMLKRMGFGGG